MELGRMFYTLALEGMDEFQDDVNSTQNTTENSSNKMVESFKKIGAAIITYLSVQKIIEFGKAVVDAAATVSAETSAFEQIMGDYSNTAQEKMKAVADATGVVDTRLTTYMTSMTAKFKGLGFDIDDATTLASEGLTLASDAAAFWDKSLDESMSHLNSFINGSYEGGEAIGLFANDTQMAQYAIKQGVIDSTTAWANLDEATKQATRLEYAKQMYEASGATGQAAKESEQYANVQANLTEKWRQFKAQIGEPLLQNVVLPAMQKLSELVDKASAAMQFLSERSETVKAVLIALGTAIGIVTTALTMQAIVQTTKAAMNAAEVTTLGALIAAKWADAAATMAALAPYLLIAAAIAALIAVIVLLVKNWDKVKEVAANVWESIKATWQSVAEWFNTYVIQPIVNFFTELWESIQNTLAGIKEFWDSTWTSISEFLSSAWETIKNVIQVALLFIEELFNGFIEIIMIPWNFIWENFGTVLTEKWEAFKKTITDGLNNINEFITNALNTIKEFWDSTWEAISNFLTPIFTAISNFISSTLDAIKQKWNAIWTAVSTFVSTKINEIKTSISSTFNSIKSTIDNVMNAVKTVISNIWNAIKTFISNTINSIKTTISNVFNSIRTAIETPLNNAKATVSNIFDSIKNGISQKINAAKDAVKSAIDKIKSFFNFTWSLPHLKLPHVSISGSFSLLPPSVPHFSVDWYAKGGILTEPTIFGYNPETGRVKVGGEAGDEAVAPIDTLLGYIKTAVGEQNAGLLDSIDRLIEMLAEYLPQLLNKDSQLVLDTGVLVGHTAAAMNEELGNIYDRNGRGG